MRSQGSKPSGFRRVVATGAAIALTASLPLLGGAGAYADDELPDVDLRSALGDQLEPGLYIVELSDDPIATYEGGVRGYDATANIDGRVDFDSPAALAYGGHLEDVQEEVANEVDVDINTQLTGIVNGFVANLSSEQAIELAMNPRVARLVPNEILQLQNVPATEYLQLEEAFADNVVGGWEGAGEGVVVGVLDTGIAPENPFFAGGDLSASANPRLEGDTIVFDKGNGGTFTGVCEAGEEFSADLCNDKLIGARYYIDGFTEARLGGDAKIDVVSPRDINGHGSHTASTAAGNANVEITSQADIPLGAMSGVAPEAKIAAYKVCWDGPDPTVTSDDGCASIDLIQGIDQATQDGVDVINFSIGGGSATSVWEAYDQYFLAANAAGVFVSASAGNSGPGASTADHASPWYATVAAATVPNFEGRVTIGEGDGAESFNGASAMLIGQPDVTGELVYGGSIPADGYSADESKLCLPGSLDTAAADGVIILCERGENARAEKSKVAGDAGAIGLVHVNVNNDSLDLDDHAIPTVHVQNTYYDTLIAAAAAGETVTLSEVALGDEAAFAPQIAGFSSRGPMNASGGDVLKPDFAAPGVGIIAAGPNYLGEDPNFVFMSGTSMAAPHAAGLGAAYMGANRDASPAEVISVLTTTTVDTVDAENNTVTDVFSQGSGMVSPTDMFDAGFYFDATIDDYLAYVAGTGEAEFDGVEPIDPSDLNIASIGIGSLVQEQTVTRTATAVGPGTYTANVTAPAGVEVTVEPSTLSFSEAGETQEFTVTFNSANAEAGAWLQGRIVWSDGEGTDVTQPLAVFPNTIESDDRIESDRTWDVQPLNLEAGATGELSLNEFGLNPVATGWDDTPGEFGSEGETEEGDYWTWLGPDDINGPGFWYETTVTTEDAAAFIAQTSSSSEGSDFDLLVAHFDIFGSLVGTWQSGNEDSEEYIEILNPEIGYYVLLVTDYTGNFEDQLTAQYATILPEGEGNLNATVIEGGEGQTGEAGTDEWTGNVEPGDVNAQVSWSGLEAGTEYYGAVVADLGTGDAMTIVHVETGEEETPELALSSIDDQDVQLGNAVVDVTPTLNDNTGASEITVEGLPEGVVFENGTITGTPTEVGEHTVTVTVTHELGFTATETFTITVTEEAPQPTDDPSPTAPEPTDDEGDNGDGDDLPRTGNTVVLWLLIVAAIAALVGAGTLAARKRLS